MFKGPEVGKGRCERGKEKAGEVRLEKGAGPWSLLGARAGESEGLERRACLGTEAVTAWLRSMGSGL